MDCIGLGQTDGESPSGCNPATDMRRRATMTVSSSRAVILADSTALIARSDTFTAVLCLAAAVVPRIFSAARDVEARWWLVSLPARVGVLLVAFLAVVAGGVFIVVHYLLGSPPTVDYSAGVTADTGATVNVVLQEDAQNTVTSHPDWVSYFVQDPKTHQWVHTTLFQVPAGSRINMTILGYDGCTPLRNPVWGKVTGTIGNIAYENGKPITQLNSWSGCNVGHTFSIPGINLNVPMGTPPLPATLCGASPCTSGPHKTMTFSFMTPKTTGDYFWQCRVPCGGGFIDGFGGPMQTIGYMTGNMVVVS
jgi:heme/copper-type cytochrome/quinol oxidase subunit 2